MLDYIFFHQTPFDEFVAFVSTKGLRPETEVDDGNYEVRLPEDIDDALNAEIEERYDALMDMNRALFESEQAEGADNYQGAGVVLNLKGGETVYADVDPGLLAKIMGVLSAEEFGEVVNAIVDTVENPDTRTFCERARDGDI